MPKPVIRLALTLAAAGLLAGCGKAAPAGPIVQVDSVFTKMPAAQAQQQVAGQTRDQREATPSKPETTKVGAPGNERN
jgi:uncharacterized lipoprotein YbaY